MASALCYVPPWAGGGAARRGRAGGAAGVREAATLCEAAGLVSDGPCGGGAVVVRGGVSPLPLAGLLRLPARLDMRGMPVRVHGARAEMPARVARSLPPATAHALAALACAHSLATRSPAVRARVALVTGTPCARLHCDKVHLRTLAALHGPGCVLAPHAAVDLAALASDRARDPVLTPEEHDCVVLADPAALVPLNTGDIAFLHGSAPDDSRRALAVVHRSPRVPHWRRRVIVQIDDVPPSCDVEEDFPDEDWVEIWAP